MKIVHVSHLYHPSTGGVQWYFKNVSERLVKDYNDEVTVVTTNSFYGPERKIFKEITPATETVNGVKVIRFAYQRGHLPFYNFLKKILAKLNIKAPDWMVAQMNGPWSAKMKNYLMNVQADAICASSSNYYYMQLPLWRRCNFFYFGSIHLSENKNVATLNQTQLKSINASSAYIANTNYEKKRLIEAGVNPEVIEVIGVGVDESEFIANDADINLFKNELGIGDKAILTAYAGRIEKTKNVIVLIESFKKIASVNSDVHLLIAGSSNDYVNELKDYCSGFESKISKRIHWKLNFSQKEKALLFNAIDILVLPSSNESFGIVFLEAWICKKPVIGAAIGAVKDVIEDNVDGLLMQPGNSDSLTVQLNLLINYKDLRESMGQRGYEKVKQNYTWDIITSRLRQCYIDKANQTVNLN